MPRSLERSFLHACFTNIAVTLFPAVVSCPQVFRKITTIHEAVNSLCLLCKHLIEL